METKEQIRARKREYYLKNKERILAKMRADYAANPSFYRDKERKYKIRNPEKARARKRREKEKNHVRYSLYWRWRNMRIRCTDPSHRDYENYGARGIRVIGALNNFKDYKEYVLNLPKPEGFDYSAKFHLDRIDNNSNYEVGNLRWVTVKENLENSRNVKNNPHLKGVI